MKPRPIIAVMITAFAISSVLSCNPQEGEDAGAASRYDFLYINHPINGFNELSNDEKQILFESFKRVGIHKNNEGVWEMRSKTGADVGISDNLFNFWKGVTKYSNGQTPAIVRRDPAFLNDTLHASDSAVRTKRRIAEHHVKSKFQAIQYMARTGFATEYCVPDSFKLEPSYTNTFFVTRHKTFEGHIKPYSYSTYFVYAESADTCARVYYPTFIIRKELESFLKDSVTPIRQTILKHSELAYAIDSTIANYTEKDWKRKWNKLISTHHADSVSRAYNADSVWIVDFPKDSVFFHRYTHCIGVYLSRHHRVPTLFKLLLTDSAYARKEQWLNRVKGCVRYLNEPERLSLERYDEAAIQFVKAMNKP